MILPFVAAAAIPLNFGATSLRGMDVARAYGADVARSAPPQAAVISFGDTATNVLGYGQAVEHIRPDIVVISFDQISDWYVEQLAHRHAEMVWPPAEAPGWLTRFLVANVGKRPVCLTHPLDLGLPNYKVVATGLLFCTQPSDAPPDLTKSVAFWQETAIPVFPRPSALDVHVEMIVFSYALSEFRLAGALAEAGDEDAARSHLRAVAAADPDRAERAIFRAMTGIGRVRGGGFDLGQRAEQALSVRPGDVASLERMLRL